MTPPLLTCHAHLQVIPGLDEGMKSMKVGGIRRLYIPGMHYPPLPFLSPLLPPSPSPHTPLPPQPRPPLVRRKKGAPLSALQYFQILARLQHMFEYCCCSTSRLSQTSLNALGNLTGACTAESHDCMLCGQACNPGIKSWLAEGAGAAS